ncbi:hypothetical protein RJT34_29156 [Clitoria ternatea]|uniref:Uncharacterized protein n=1 Tax=Clitoria ternatea TaxID=43366 RepID=A0AAN9ID01_CLITE
MSTRENNSCIHWRIELYCIVLTCTMNCSPFHSNVGPVQNAANITALGLLLCKSLLANCNARWNRGYLLGRKLCTFLKWKKGSWLELKQTAPISNPIPIPESVPTPTTISTEGSCVDAGPEGHST